MTMTFLWKSHKVMFWGRLKEICLIYISYPDVETYSAVSLGQQRPFHRQHTSVDEALPGHEVQDSIHFLHAAYAHQAADDNVQRAFLRRQHLLEETQESYIARRFPGLYLGKVFWGPIFIWYFLGGVRGGLKSALPWSSGSRRPGWGYAKPSTWWDRGKIQETRKVHPTPSCLAARTELFHTRWAGRKAGSTDTSLELMGENMKTTVKTRPILTPLAPL